MLGEFGAFVDPVLPLRNGKITGLYRQDAMACLIEDALLLGILNCAVDLAQAAQQLAHLYSSGENQKLQGATPLAGDRVALPLLTASTHLWFFWGVCYGLHCSG